MADSVGPEDSTTEPLDTSSDNVAPAPAKKPRYGWFGRHKVLTSVLAVVAIIVVSVIATNGSGTTDTASTGDGAPSTATAAAAAPSVASSTSDEPETSSSAVTTQRSSKAPETTKSQQTSAKVPAPDKGADLTGFEDGTFLVGSTVKPGTYRNGEGTSSCYWARLSGTTSTLDDVIANDNATGPAVVTIAKTDKAFNSERCGRWSS